MIDTWEWDKRQSSIDMRWGMIQHSDQRIQLCYYPDWVIYEGAPKLSSVVCKTRTAVEPLLIKSLYHFIGMRQREPFHIPWIIPLTSAVKCIYHLFILMLYLILSLGNEHDRVCKFYWWVESVWLLLHKFWSHFGIFGVKYQTFQRVVPACIH